VSERGRPRNFDREQALRSAMYVFWEKGFDGASLSDLTAAMGINAPSLYAAFGSKEGLYMDALSLYSNEVGTDIWTQLEETPDVKQAFERFLIVSAETFSVTDKPRGCLIALDALNRTQSSQNVCNVLKERRNNNIEVLRTRLQRSIDEGALPATIDTSAIATFYATVQNDMSILARDGGSAESLVAAAHGAMAAWDRLTAA
jgi:AcrR family transcriptional regulator